MGRIAVLATAPIVQSFMNPAPLTPLQAQALLAEQGHDWWRAWEVPALERVCAAVPDEALADWPDVARWRALLAVMTERSDALNCLELAYAGHQARGDHAAARLDALMALVACVIDFGGMAGVADWLLRAGAPEGAEATAEPEDRLWRCAGAVARAVHGGATPPEVADAADWLQSQLPPLRTSLAADERLLAAQVLVNLHLLGGRFERFDALALAVEDPATFDAASPLSRARWLNTLGFAHYHIGNLERAQRAWQQALELSRKHALRQMDTLSSLALLRLWIDLGRLDEAQALESAVLPQWGAGRDGQLVQLKQMGARLRLARGQAVQALALLDEGLAVAAQAGLTYSELAGCHLDRAQLLIANRRLAEAEAALEQYAQGHAGRDAEIFHCLLELMQGWQLQGGDGEGARGHLEQGLQRAQRARYTMFFRLVPRIAAEVCALALRWDVEPVFAAEVVRLRHLPAPAHADERWPWALYVRLLGGFELSRDGAPLSPSNSGKAPKKPLELLRALACAPEMCLGLAEAADALWPQAEGDAAGKNLEVTIQRLRRILADDDRSLVTVHDGRVGLDRTRVGSDVCLRRQAVAALEALALEPGEPGAGLALVRRIVSLTRGPLLPGAPEAPWLQHERERCSRDLERARAALAAALAGTAAAPAAVSLLSAL